MMADDRNPIVENLFAEPVQDLAGDAFVDGVMTQTRNRVYWLIGALAAVALMLGSIAWFFSSTALEIVQLLTRILTTSLFDAGEGWMAWILLPVNSIAGLLVICTKAARMAWKRMFGVRLMF